MMRAAILRDPCSGLRSGNLFSNRATSVLDAPEQDRVSAKPKSSGLKRRAEVTEMPLRRDPGYEYGSYDDTDPGAEESFPVKRRNSGIRLSLRGRLLPNTVWGRIGLGIGLVTVSAAAIGGCVTVRSFLLHDPHFVVPGPEAIQTTGNSHLTRAQLLSVFGGDVDRNVFQIPLTQRRAELESLPWVAHATVMRLLPDRVRVAVIERTPVAFVRQGGNIGLVDANGVLFDLPSPDAENGPGPEAVHYSFPVLTGISANDPLSTRAARMKIFMGFMSALDAGGEEISHKLSEVDVSNPEDVKAILPDGSGHGPDILVHFGEDKFLERYHTYQEHLAEWKQQYPRLTAVDMRYERQVVLEMQPGAAPAPAGPVAAASPAPVMAKAAAVKPSPARKTFAKRNVVAKAKPKARRSGAAR